MSIVCVDFDSTIHPYTEGWTGPIPSNEPPIEGARDFLERLKELGYTIIILSARATTDQGWLGIMEWLETYDLLRYVYQVTDIKVAAVAYIDDRGVVFRGNYDECIEQIQRLASAQAQERVVVNG